MKVIKKIRVQAVRREGFDGYFCARRFIPAGSPLEMDVVETEKDGAGVPIEPTINVEVTDPTTGTKRIETRPDPARVSVVGYEQLVEDPTVSVKEGDDLELGEALTRLATVTAERDRLASENVELARDKAAAEGKVVALQAALAAAAPNTGKPTGEGESQPPAPSSQDPAGSQSRGKGK